MKKTIKEEYDRVVQKRDEVKKLIQDLEQEEGSDSYNVRINRDRLAYWEGKREGLEFALDHLTDSDK